ncbi:GntR family transcriptional regulator [Pseudonocardia sp. MCCB 268]|nr:GntR family transcriptional regulator [Pseudonocardia cytotoxica]
MRDSLPSETTLVAQYGVSEYRTAGVPAVDSGLVVIRHGSGAFVRY